MGDGKLNAMNDFTDFSTMFQCIRTRLMALLIWTAVLFLSQVPLAGADKANVDPDLEEAWRDLATLKVTDAHSAFEEAYKMTESQESAYGLALCLLNTQPKTNGNIEEARRLLEGLADDGETDATKINARYFLARIDQVHQTEIDREAAIEAYRSLLEDFPDNSLAEKAVSKLASALLIQNLPDDVWEAHYDEISAHLDRLTIQSNRAATELVMIEALLRIKTDHVRALPLLVDLLDTNPELRADLRRDFVIQAIDSARALGEDQLADKYATTFLEDYAYDPRAGAIQAWMEGSAP